MHAQTGRTFHLGKTWRSNFGGTTESQRKGKERQAGPEKRHRSGLLRQIFRRAMTDNTNIATLSEWGDSVDPTIMMDLMKRLKVCDNVNLIGTNKKNFWPSYPKTWAQLNDSQKNKAMEWFRNCSVAGKQALLAKATAETVIQVNNSDSD